MRAVEHDATELEVRLARIVERDRGDHTRRPGVREIDERNGIGQRVVHPSPGRRTVGIALERDAAGNPVHVHHAAHFATVRIHGEEPVRRRRRDHECRVVVAHRDAEGRRKRLVEKRVLRRQGLEFQHVSRPAGAAAVDLGDAVQEGAVFHFGHAVALRARLAVGVVARVRLGDEYALLGVHRDAVQQSPQRVDDLHASVRSDVVDVQVAVRDVRVLHDVGDVAPGDTLVTAVGGLCDVPAGIEGTQDAVDVLRPTARDLRLVVGLERNHVQPIALHRERARVLGGDVEVFADGSRCDVDDGDPVRGGERNVGLGVTREGNAHRLIEHARPGGVESGDRMQDLVARRTRRVGVDDAHRVRDVVADPHFLAVRPDGNAHRVDADADSRDDLAGSGINHVNGVRRRVHRVDE